MDFVIQYVKPELFILCVVLYIIGMTIKKTNKIADWHIPFILGGISLILCTIYLLSVSPSPKTYQEILALIFTIIIQAICCVAIAVYGNQLIKQYAKKDVEGLIKDNSQE